MGGRKGLRVADQKHLTYTPIGQDPDLASHLFLSVTRHLLSLVPMEIFPATVKWACYAIGHQAADLVRTPAFKKEIIPIGKDLPPHPGDQIATLWSDTGMIRHHHDWLMSFSDETFPGLIFHGLDAQSGAQLMEVLGCEMDHRLPSELPTKYGTVASLSAQIAEHIMQME